MNVEKIRNDFPFLKRKIVYLDSAATSQKPIQVIDAISDFYKNHCGNVRRGVYSLSREASELYDSAREKTANLINSGFEETVFTKNATEGINLVVSSLDIKKGDEVILTEMEHHSNVVPWMMKGAKIKYIPFDKKGNLEIEKLGELITKKTKAIGCIHVSNFFGSVNNVNKISKIAGEKNIPLVLDAAQSVPHKKVDVKKLKCDFMVFSAHKMCGPGGVGVLYGRKEMLEEFPPFLGGGDMISNVGKKGFSTAELPWKFEAGTPNAAGVHAFGAAIDYLQKIGFEKIQQHEEKLVKKTIAGLKNIGNIEIYGPEKRAGIVAFNLKELDAFDVSVLLDSRAKIAIRSGNHCVQPAHKKLGIKSSARASFYVYNNKEEVRLFLEQIKEIVDGITEN